MWRFISHAPGRLGLAIFLTALLVRVVYLWQYVQSPLFGYYGVDHQYYLDWAGRIAAGDWLGREIFEQGPLYAYLLGALFSIVGERLIPVLSGQLLIGACGCVLVYACGRRLFDEPAAALAGFATALYGPLVFYECAPMKTFLSPFLSLLALYAGLRYGEGRLFWLALAGIAVGLACLVRENHILLLIPLALAVVLSARRRSLPLAVLAAAVGLGIAPATLHNAIAGGEFVPVTAGGGEAFYMAHGPHAGAYYTPPPFVLARAGIEHEDFRREAERRVGRELTRAESSRYWFGEGLRNIVEKPLRALRLTLEKARVLFDDFEVPDNASYEIARRFVPLLGWLPTFGWIGGLGFLGMALTLRDPRRFQLPLGFVAAHVISILAFYNFGRFRSGMLPVWILFAAFGAIWLVRNLQHLWRDRNFRPLGPVVSAVVAVALITVMTFSPREPVRYAVHAAFTTGVLARQAGDYVLAERELQRALELHRQQAARSGDWLTASRRYDLARTHQELAVVLMATGRYHPAATQLRRAREVPNRESVREELLRYELAVIHSRVPHDVLTAADSPLRVETIAAIEELRVLAPDERLEPKIPVEP